MGGPVNDTLANSMNGTAVNALIVKVPEDPRS